MVTGVATYLVTRVTTCNYCVVDIICEMADVNLWDSKNDGESLEFQHGLEGNDGGCGE